MSTPAHKDSGHWCGHAPGASAEMAASTGMAAGGGLAPAASATQGSSWTLNVKRWVLWFLAFFGLYASSSVCPFCGTPGCPVGVGGAAVVGGVFAWLWQYGKRAWGKVTGFFFRRSC